MAYPRKPVTNFGLGADSIAAMNLPVTNLGMGAPPPVAESGPPSPDDLAGTIYQLGLNANGDFKGSVFVAKYRQMSEEVRTALFGPAGSPHRSAVEALADPSLPSELLHVLIQHIGGQAFARIVASPTALQAVIAWVRAGGDEASTEMLLQVLQSELGIVL